jgi:PAS domain S-box-containing protein
MEPGPGIKPAVRVIEPGKFFISFMLGLTGFLGSFFTLNFSSPPFFISINWFDFLPLLAGMAFGGRYGLIASTLGLGAIYPFILWPNNGWACLVTTILLIYWPAANGYFRRLRERSPALWNNPNVIYPVSVLIFNLAILIFFPVAMRFNPPFWNPKAELFMPAPVLDGIFIKGIIVLYVLIIFVDLLLKLPLIRKLFGLEIKKEARNNGKLFLIIIISSFLVWYIFVIFDRVLLNQTIYQGFFRISDAHEIIAILVFISAGIFTLSIVINYQESRLKAEDSLRTNQERLQLAIRAANIGIWDWDIVRNILIWDDSMYSLYGVAKEDFRGDYEAWRKVLHPDDLGFNESEVQAAIRGESEYNPEFRIIRTDGSIRTIKAASQTIKDKKGKALRMVGINMDITGRKESEEKILRALNEKETLLRELYHRTKNTMQIIMSMISLEALEFPSNRAVKKVVKNTEDRIQAISLVHQMLYKSHDLSRISIKTYIVELSHLILKSFGISGGMVSLDINSDDKYLMLDTAIPFGLILNELITNSLKYAFPDGRKGKITIRLTAAEPDKIILKYADDGIGLPEGFDFQNQKSLGLRLIKNIGCDQMKGRIEFENKNGFGCVFEFQNNLRKIRFRR